MHFAIIIRHECVCAVWQSDRERNGWWKSVFSLLHSLTTNTSASRHRIILDRVESVLTYTFCICDHLTTQQRVFVDSHPTKMTPNIGFVLCDGCVCTTLATFCNQTQHTKTHATATAHTECASLLRDNQAHISHSCT